MPEGDTVFQAAHRLDEALRGQVVTRFDLRVPGAATIDLSGESVHGVAPRGKHILMRIGDQTLHSHLRMDGAWRLYRPGEKWRHPAFKVRAIVGTATRDAVGVDIAEVRVVATRDENELVGHLGPDPLADDWDAEEAARRLGADPRSIHVALLDQRNVAGFGNEYAAEILFLRGILPETPTPDVDVEALIALGARTIRANRDRVDRTFTGDARRGFTDWVYGRANRPCRRCGTLIRRGRQGDWGPEPGPRAPEAPIGAERRSEWGVGSEVATHERITFWCPNCQR